MSATAGHFKAIRRGCSKYVGTGCGAGCGVMGLHYTCVLHSMCGLHNLCDLHTSFFYIMCGLHKGRSLIKDDIGTPYQLLGADVYQPPNYEIF